MVEPESSNRTAGFPSSIGIGTILIFALTFLVYFPALRGEFLWDDNIMLTENPHIHAGDGLSKIWFSTDQPDYLPLTSTSLWIEWRFWGMHSIGYHVTNVLLHALNAFLLWQILLRMKIPGAFLAAMIFAVHPVCVASVAWIAERKNTLSMFLYLLSVLFFLRSSDVLDERKSAHRRGWHWLSLLTFLLALLSKGSVVILPGVLLLLFWWQRSHRGKNASSNLLRLLPFFILSAVFAAVTIWFQFHRSSRGETVDKLDFIGKDIAATRAIWFYLFKVLWPSKLSMIYPQWNIHPSSLLEYVPGILLIVLFIFLWQRRQSWGRPALFALGYFVIALLPVLGFVDMYFLTYSRVSDHWQYLAMMGVIVLCASGVQALKSEIERRKPNLNLGLCALDIGLIVVLSVLGWQRAQMFSSAEKLWTDTLSKNPSAWAAHSHLGKALSERGDLEQAAAHFSEALKLNPNSSETHYNFGNTLMGQGKFSEAASEFTEAFRIKPNYPEAHYNLGLAFERLGKTDDALGQYADAIRLHPRHANAHNNLGNLLARRGRDDEAAAHYKKALALKPNLPEAHNNLANVLQRSGKIEESIPHYLEAIALKPDYLDAHKNLAIALNSLGRTHEAEVHSREVLRLEQLRK
jgi:tetratricopeptide (TPR) repeat protein